MGQCHLIQESFKESEPIYPNDFAPVYLLLGGPVIDNLHQILPELQ